MHVTSAFEHLPNELYLCIFDYLNPIDLVYSFSNLTTRLNKLLKAYSRFSSKSLNLINLNPRVFDYYCVKKAINDQIDSISLTDQQLKLIQFSSRSRICQLTIFVENEIHFYSDEQYLFENLEKLIIENKSFTWEKPFLICPYLTEVIIHLKNHPDLIHLLNSLPVVEKCHVTLDYDVTSCRENDLIVKYLSKRLIDFSYIINSDNGLVYFVTDYSLIELLIKQMKYLIKLRLYIIGCSNTEIDGRRLEKNLFDHLPKLEEFHFFFQTYGGKELKLMNEFLPFQWHFGSYTNQLSDMHFLFTLPFQFQCLDECVNEYFLKGIRTTFQKSNDLKMQLGLNSIKHLDLSCSINENLLNILRNEFENIESIRFSSCTAEYRSPPSLARQSRFLIKSLRTLIFDQSCLHQSAFIRLLPNLTQLIINQKLLNIIFEETGDGYLYHITHLHVYSFQRYYLDQMINAFPNLIQLKLKTIQTDDEGPIRSFLDGRCHHKHLPVSVTDTLNDLLKHNLRRLKQIEVGCYFERDEQHLHAILSRVINKYKGDQIQFHIQSEPFQSTRCGLTKIVFF